MLEIFSSLRKKINSLGLPSTLFLLLIFFLPFQERYYKPLKKLAKIAFAGQFFPPYFFDKVLDYHLGDFFMIALLGMTLFSRRTPPLYPPQKFLFLFLGISFLSIFFSAGGSYLWPYWRWLQLALPFLTFFIALPKLDMKKLIPLCFWILFATSLFQCVLTIAQYIHQESIGLKALGEIDQHWDYSASFGMKNRERWIFDSLFNLKAPSEKILRPAGTFPYPNILGGFLGMALFASSYLFFQLKKKGSEWMMGLAICLQIFTLCLTFSRGALFGVIGSSFFFFSYLFFKSHAKNTAVKLLLFFILGGALSGVILHKQFLERGGIVNYNEISKGSDEPRLYYQKMALAMAKSKPLLGRGFGQYVIEMNEFRGDFDVGMLQKVHNIYLLLLAETGVLGLLSFLTFLGSVIYTIGRRGIDLMSMSLLSIFIYFLWFGCVDHFWIAMHHGREMFCLIPGLLFSYLISQKESQELRIQSS